MFNSPLLSTSPVTLILGILNIIVAIITGGITLRELLELFG